MKLTNCFAKWQMILLPNSEEVASIDTLTCGCVGYIAYLSYKVYASTLVCKLDGDMCLTHVWNPVSPFDLLQVSTHACKGKGHM